MASLAAMKAEAADSKVSGELILSYFILMTALKTDNRDQFDFRSRL